MMEVPRRNQCAEIPPMHCGFFAYRPKHLQRFNCMRSFMGFFTTLLVVYGMGSPYMSSVLPSMEKRFGFSSRSMGIIMSVMDFGMMLMALITAHFGGRRGSHRPRYLFVGSVLCGISCIVLASPELFFPMDAASVVGRMMASANTTEHLCTPSSNVTHIVNNSTVCELENEGNAGALIVMCVAEFFLGVGSTVLLILGLPFIDDNVHLDDAPIYFAISFFGRIFGPMLGFGLGAVCNNIFLDFSKPRFLQTDPNWVSAWYLGFLVIGIAVILFALVIGCFPAQISNGRETLDYYAEVSSKKLEADLSSCDITISSSEGARTSWRDFADDMKRLVTNFAFMCRAVSNVLDGMIITGFLAFFFKFIAQQFQLSQAVASLLGGVPTIFGVALGVVVGGVLIRKYKLQPKHVCLMLVSSAALMCVVSLIAINLGCERTEILGLNGSESLHKLYEGYNVGFNDTYCSTSLNCGCSELEFRPVYDPKSGVNFYSPCHAGCNKYQIRELHDEELRYYDNCSCVKNSVWFYDDVDDQMLNGRMVGGFAPKQCPLLPAFILVFFVAMFFLGLPLAGSIMVQYRLVDPDLKSMSTAVTTVLTSAFGYLPAPIFMGSIVDSTCRLWQKSSCGENKFCLLYDTDEFRWRFLMTAACIKAIGAVLDIIVTFKMWHMRFDRTLTEGAAAPGVFSSTTTALTSASSCPSFSSVHSEAHLEVEEISRSSAADKIRKNVSLNDLATSKL